MKIALHIKPHSLYTCNMHICKMNEFINIAYEFRVSIKRYIDTDADTSILHNKAHLDVSSLTRISAHKKYDRARCIYWQSSEYQLNMQCSLFTFQWCLQIDNHYFTFIA